jgi:hypothetical protein
MRDDGVIRVPVFYVMQMGLIVFDGSRRNKRFYDVPCVCVCVGESCYFVETFRIPKTSYYLLYWIKNLDHPTAKILKLKFDYNM